MLRNLIFYIGYIYYVLLIKTVQSRLINEEIVQEIWRQNKNAVFCSPHHFLLALFVGTDAAKMERPIVTVLASLSKDGELIAKLLKRRRFELIRGSSSRGGMRALIELNHAGKSGKSLGLAFDGPKGPPLIPKRGLIGCARAIHGEVILVYGFAYPNKFLPFLKPFRVRSWDRFLVLVPFCRVDVIFEKIPIPFFEENIEMTHEQIQAQENSVLNFIQKRSFEIYENLYKNWERKKKKI